MILRASTPLLAVCMIMFASHASAADVSVGESIYDSRGCASCHGVGGKSQVDIYPTLAGKTSNYIGTELGKFRSKERVNPTMNAMASSLTDSDIENIAAFLSSQ